MAQSPDNFLEHNSKELLEKIGELYFRSNGVELKYRSPRFIKLIGFFDGLISAFFNPISIIVNVLSVAIFFIFINKTLFAVILFLIIFAFVLILEGGIFVPAYCRKTSADIVKRHCRLVASHLINILQVRLHDLLCNRDGTVKDFVPEIIAPVFCNKLGTLICSQFGITSEIIQLIILFLANRELKNFCSIIPSSMGDDEFKAKLQMLKEEMKMIEKNHNR